MNSTSSTPLRSAAVLIGLLLVLCAWSPRSLAGPGHDHGDEKPLPAAAASPRFAAHSDLFEIVGIVKNQTLTLYVDRYATNEPVSNAKVEYELNGTKGEAVRTAQDTFELPLTGVAGPAELALTFTITAGDEIDLLASNLSLPDAHDHHDVVGTSKWMRYGGVAAAVLVSLAGLLMLWRRRRVAA